MARVGSEYRDPRRSVDSDHSTRIGRLAFYRCIEEDAPEVLKALRDDVLPDWPGPKAENALARWAEKSGLSDPWAVADARATLDWWRAWPRSLAYERLCFFPESWGGPVHEGPPIPPLELPEANLTVETWDAYEHRARAAFEGRLRAYREAWTRYAEENGLIAAPEKRKRRGGPIDEHFHWLVRFQVQRWSHEKIGSAHAPRRSAKSVATAVRSTADLIGLTRRSTPQ